MLPYLLPDHLARFQRRLDFIILVQTYLQARYANDLIADYAVVPAKIVWFAMELYDAFTLPIILDSAAAKQFVEGHFKFALSHDSLRESPEFQTIVDAYQKRGNL